MRFSQDTQRRIPYLFGLIIILYMIKPAILFKPNGKPRSYGVGSDDDGYKKTLYTFQFCIILIVILLVTFY